MNEIINKINALRSAGFEPLSILLTQEFFNDIKQNELSVMAVGLPSDVFVRSEMCGLPIKIKEPSHILYSIEVA